MAAKDSSDLKWVTLFDNVSKNEVAKAEKPGEGIPDLPSPGGNKPANKRLSVERIYQKKSQLEHILLRPDTYIGSVEPVTTSMWLYDEEVQGMIQREITYVPGLYKIFDEILVNAADNKQRDPKMNCIKIDINVEANKIKIWNNGKGIPVVEHKTEKMFVPTLIFGHLLTSSNYNDEERKVTGGRNGYGAKLCNIFSNKFTVETSCKQYRKKFKQSWSKNMGKTSEPTISANDEDDFTCITFCPDLEKFKMERLEPDTVALFTRRAYDIAASSKGVKVFLNGKRLPVKCFRDYVDLYLKDKTDDTGSPLKVVHEQVNERWEVAVTLSEKGFQQASFVNSIATTKGGRHVDYITDQVVSKLINNVKKKGGKGNVQVKPFQIKTHLWIFVNCLIENPTFDSQTKENMTKQSKGFGSTCVLSEKFMNNVNKCGIVESIMSWMKFKAQAQLNKKSGSKHSKLKGIPKLDDANEAGTKNSQQCTLILTEGDSAKTLAVAGLGVVGRDHYGVFPLKGKVLNVREASHKQIMENAEVNNIIKILGLQYKKSYDDADALKTLRYGKMMIMTDQDQDGSHIKGLLINFIHHNWPSLLRHRFLQEFITPIVKVSKGNTTMSFYSLPEFEEWKKDTENWHTYKVKYYKGLGTSTAKEAKDYFSDMNRHLIPFKYVGPEDDSSIVLAFSKKKIEERKEWLRNWMEEKKRRAEMGLPEIYVYGKDTKHLTYNEFVNRELILFSNMDNERSIPSLCDGLKPGQRKVMFTCFKRNLVKELKVAQLAGSVAEISAYHHGEASLMGTIINLAQNFVGSNNINLLQPIGQFGTRLHGGKDAASPRYIFTALSPLARLLFPATDEPLLKHCYDDNAKIEPEWYLPIIPMVLVNGAEGIGTGWSTKIPNYDPREIVGNIRRLLDGQDPVPMQPSYKNFKGSVDEIEDQKYVTSGEVSVLDETTIEITELPVRSWTQAYKESVLEPMLYGTEKTPSVITDYKEYHTDTTVKFVIKMNPAKLLEAEEKGLHSFFKLQSSMSTSSMVLFDHMGVLKRYNTVDEIVREFYTVRLEYYQKRKDYLEGMLSAESLRLDNQARFICEKIEGKIKIENMPKKDLIQLLVRRGYDSDPVKAWKEAQNKLENDSQNDTDDDDQSEMSAMSGGGPDFNYILNMPLWSLSRERKEELLKNRDAKAREIEVLRNKTNSDLWREDLDAFIEQLQVVEAQEREEEKVGVKMLPSKSGKGRPKPKKLAVETLPSPMGRRVEPRVDALRQKAEGEKKKAKKIKKEDDSQTKLDSYGMLEDESQGSSEPQSLADRLGLNKEAKKAGPKKAVRQTKLDFSSVPKKKITPKKKKKKTNPWDSESDDDMSEDDLSDAEPVVIPRERGPRRAAAAKKTCYNLSDSEADDDNANANAVDISDNDSFKPDDGSDNEDSFVAVQSKRKPAGKKMQKALESDDEVEMTNTQSSEVVSVSDSEEVAPSPKKAPAKKNAGKVGGGGGGGGDDGSKPAKKPRKPIASQKKLQEVLSDSEGENAEPKKVVKKKALGKKTVGKKEPGGGSGQLSIIASFNQAASTVASSSQSDDKVKPKAAPKRKKPVSDDESEEEFGKKKKKSTAAKKKKIESDSDSDVAVTSPVEKRSMPGRSRPAAKYTYDDSDSDFDF